MIDTLIQPEDLKVLEEYGCTVFQPKQVGRYYADESNLYHYQAFFGMHLVKVPYGSTCFYLSVNELGEQLMIASKGLCDMASDIFAVVITGYMVNAKSVEISRKFCLPYVNGCSTKQVMAPERVGDPTVQLLRIPPFAAEQAHHIHSTVRVVHILEGSGTCIVGMENNQIRLPLIKGLSMVLEPMCPHHFETDKEPLICLPVHVFSSHGAGENNHPMFNGTFMMNHGMV